MERTSRELKKMTDEMERHVEVAEEEVKALCADLKAMEDDGKGEMMT